MTLSGLGWTQFDMGWTLLGLGTWVKFWKNHWGCKLELVPTYIHRYILYSVNLRFPPGFEEGHFHGFSSGGTKILMNCTHTVRRKKWRQTSCCFPCVLWVPIGVEVGVSGQSLSFGIWSRSLQYLIDSDYALESPSTSCKFAVISGCICNLTMPINCYIPSHIHS